MQPLNITPPSNVNNNPLMRIRSISSWITEPWRNNICHRPANTLTVSDYRDAYAQLLGFLVGLIGGLLILISVFGVDRVEDAPPLKMQFVILFIVTPLSLLGSIILSVTMARSITIGVPLVLRAAVDLHSEVVLWNARRVLLNYAMAIISINDRPSNRNHTKELPPELLGSIYSFLTGTTEAESYALMQRGIRMIAEQQKRKCCAIGSLTFFTPITRQQVQVEPGMIETEHLLSV